MAFVPIYILILGFTIVIDFIAGICLEKILRHSIRRAFLIVSLIANIGVLAFFKYYNFFNHEVDSLLAQFNYHSPFSSFSILLPIGLSFHTFQAMSYTIEVYRRKQKAERHFGIYALYVMFYPQLVAGPIERPQNILHQFHEKKIYDFEKMKSGLLQMATGLFKKVVIADRLGTYVDPVFAHPENYSSATLSVASIFYAFQIYCDFSGYCDIGIGAARTMGFSLMNNFNAPYLSRSVSEFWSRWHISLSTWFRDYLYIPLGGNRVSVGRWYFNLIIVFLLSGLWHGANWTFIAWGALHGFYLVTANEKNKILTRFNLFKQDTFLIRFIECVTTFLLITIAWIFFRSKDLSSAWFIIKKIFEFSLSEPLQYFTSYSEILFSGLLIILLLIKDRYKLMVNTTNTLSFCILLFILIGCSYFFGVFTNNQFIYFQF